MKTTIDIPDEAVVRALEECNRQQRVKQVVAGL